MEITRRDFLKATVTAGGIWLLPSQRVSADQFDEYPDAEFLGRNCQAGILNFRVRPNSGAEINKIVYEDALFPVYREVVGDDVPGTFTSVWYETPYGYAYAPGVQLVKVQLNEPETELPDSSNGKGFWAEITVPYVNVIYGAEPKSEWYKQIQHHNPRLYYQQVFWVDEIKTATDGTILYRANELIGSYGDIIYADARAFRRITPEEIAPISPEVENKRVHVSATYQTMTAYENEREVFFCRVSTGTMYTSDGQASRNYTTPVGTHYPWRKAISLHMAGALTGGGWDTPGVPWNIIFATGGAAIHGVFWHNAFGTPRSHGCVNCKMDDAKWIWRFVNPIVEYDPGDLTVSGPVGTPIEVTY